MDFTYRKLESCGEIFFRILSRFDSGDSWKVATGTIDYSREDEARREVQRLAEKTPGYIVTVNWEVR